MTNICSMHEEIQNLLLLITNGDLLLVSQILSGILLLLPMHKNGLTVLLEMEEALTVRIESILVRTLLMVPLTLTPSLDLLVFGVLKASTLYVVEPIPNVLVALNLMCGIILS